MFLLHLFWKNGRGLFWLNWGNGLFNLQEQNLLIGLVLGMSSFETLNPPLKCNLFYRKVQFNENNAFVGFQKDTSASVIFQATNILMSARQGKGRRWLDILRWSGLKSEDYTSELKEDTVNDLCT